LQFVYMTAMLLCLTQFAVAENAQKSRPNLHFESVVRAESEMGKGLATTLQKVVNNIGYELIISDFPARRGMEELRNGRVDGSLGRIGNLTQLLNTQEIIRLDVPLMSLKVSRWCVPGADKLQRTLKVGFRLGAVVMIMVSEAINKDHIDLVEIRSQMSSVKMLSTSRIDCLLSNDLVLATEGVKPDDLKPFHRFDFMTVQVFSWISARHARLKPVLEQELKTYDFPPEYRQKFLTDKPVCENAYDVLCPDGFLFLKRVDFRTRFQP